MKNTAVKINRYSRGFSLAELLVAIMIGAMVLVSVLNIYSRIETSAAAVRRKLDSSRLPAEVLQLIAEDLDRITSAGSDTRITIPRGKFVKGYSTGQLVILKTINADVDVETFEEIIWQSHYDYDGGSDSLVLYRSHRGMVLEDKLLEEGKESWETELFVPVCQGVTFFKIEVLDNNDVLEEWRQTSLPNGIRVTISFAEPYETVSGDLEVADEDKIIRTIAIDRVRKIPFKIEKPDPNEFDDESEKEEDDEDGRDTKEKKENESEVKKDPNER